ncbi:MAG: geranylgeranyl reductase family protein [Candidatus Thalassarchaeaceae archaeon]|jgi:geranylgeranyl reductase family protein|nr:geranylgeranyl reductase family protein [Candidatus Thalassarchaeaceae archaeon]MDP7042682.1 geranylgeranyl reductase family protein [Candidatus Thalassarchaeaceae archaeon]
MATERVDVVIVGAGPVGGYLGNKLSSAGLSVLMLEEHLEIGRPFQCAGLVTPEAMSKVGLESSILSSVWGARIHSPRGTSVMVGNEDNIKTHIVCRKMFDEGIVSQAIKAGSRLWLNSRPIEAEHIDGGIRIEIDRAGEEVTVEAALLCGADGAHSWVRRYFKMGIPKEFMVGFQAEVVNYGGSEGLLDMYTGEEVAPGLFAWVIPCGNSWRVGVWARPEDLGGRSCEELYETLISHPLWKERFANSKEVARYCGPLPCGIVSRPVLDRIALFGDAVGLCKPTTGGGIGPSFNQVDLMSDGLISAVKKDNLSLTKMKKIAKPLKNMKKEQKRARILRNLYLTDCSDDELEKTFYTFAKPNVVEMINKYGDIEKPVALGIRMLKEVPEFRALAASTTWALLKG